MKRIVLPILLLTISSPAFAMWGWFKRKPAQSAVAPTTQATDISAVEPVKEQGEIKAELQEVPATISGAESEAEVTFEDVPGFELPEIEKFAVTGAALARQNEMALIVAINTGDTEKVKQLIDDKKVDVKKPFKLLFYAGQTPLEVIIANDTPKKFEIAKLFLEAGADKEVLNKFAESAIIDKDEKLVNWLTEQGIIAPAKEVEVVELEPAVEEAKVAEVIAPEEVIAEEVQTVVNPISNYPLRIKQLAPAPEEVVTVESPTYTVTLEGEKIEAIEPVKAAQPAARPLSKSPAIMSELETEEFIKPVAVPQVARPLPAVPVVKPAPAVVKQPVRARVWPSTPAPQPVTSKVEITPLATRPLPATPATQPVRRALPTPPARVQEVNVEVTPKAVRPLPTPPGSVQTSTPVVRPLPALPK